MASLRRIGILFRLELRSLTRDPRLLVALFAVPVILTVIADLSFNWPGSLPGTLAVQDQDRSELSKRVAGQLLKAPRSYQLTSEDVPGSLVVAHPDVVVVVLTAGFQQRVLRGDYQPLLVVADRRGQSRSAAAFSAINSAAAETSAVALATGEARRAAQKHNAPDNGDAAALSAMRSSLKNYSGDRVRISNVWFGSQSTSSFTRMAQFVTGNGVMFMLFIAVGLASALAADRSEGRLRRLLWSRLRVSEVVAAKVMATLLLGFACMTLIIATSVLGFGMSLGPSPLELVGITLAVAIAVSGFALLILGIGRTGVVVQGLGTILTLGLSALGGSWWPQEVEPPYLRAAGHISLNAWASDAYHLLLFDGQTGTALLLPIGILLAFGLIEGAAGAFFFSRSIRRA